MSALLELVPQVVDLIRQKKEQQMMDIVNGILPPDYPSYLDYSISEDGQVELDASYKKS